MLAPAASPLKHGIAYTNTPLSSLVVELVEVAFKLKYNNNNKNNYGGSDDYISIRT